MINIFFLFVYVFFFGSFSAVELYYMLTAQAVILIIAYLRKNKTTIITPLFIFYISIILTNYANLQMISQIGTPDLKITYLLPQYIDEAAQLWCISITLTIMGYHWAINKSFPVIGFDLKKVSILQTIFWVLFALNALNILGLGINLRGGIILKLVGLLNSVAVLFFARLWTRQNNKQYRNYSLTLYFLQTYLALTTAFLRFDLILPTGCLFLGFFIGKGEIRYIFTYRVIPFLLILGFYSSVFKSLQANRSNFISVIVSDREDDADVSDEKKNSGALLARSSNVAQMTNIISLVKRNGFYEGRASQPLLAALIPRALWPDKPAIALGQWFALAVTGSEKNARGGSTNSINMTIPGELYLDFGWIGVVIGSILFGALIPPLWNSSRFYSSELNLAGTVFGGYLFILAIAGFGGDLQIVITLMSTYLGLYILEKIVKGAS